MNCPESIAELMEMDFGSFATTSSCEDLRKSIAIASRHILILHQDPCLYEEQSVLINGRTIKCTQDAVIDRLNRYIKCWQAICDDEVKKQSCCARRPSNWKQKRC